MFLRICLLLAGVGVHAYGFSQTFNRRYDSIGAGLAQFGWAVEQAADGHYTVLFNSPWQDSLFYSSVVCSMKLNAWGDAIDTARFIYANHATYPGWANSSDARTDGGYVVGGSTYAQDETQRAALFLLDPNGQPESIIEYGDVGEEWIGRQAKQTPDGGYVVVGETSTMGVIDAFLLKFDALGEVEWVQTYGGPTLHDVVWSVDMDGLGGYYLGGQQQVSSSNYDQWVLHVDGTGQVIWQENYGTPFNDAGNAHLTTGADGSIFIATGLEVNANDDHAPRLIKLDAEGGVLWQQTYGPARNTMIYVVQEVFPGGDLITAGSAYNINNFLSGILIRATSEGDSLWMREYVYYDADVAAGRGAFRDVQPTPDGGFIAVGVALGVAGFYGQDVWVVKTDSMGCLEPGCDTVMGITTQITNLRGALVVSPNPVAAGQPVQVSINLPASFTPRGVLRITVTDAAGRLFQEQPVPSGVSGFSFQFSAYPGGLYHLHLTDDSRWISGAKLMVD